MCQSLSQPQTGACHELFFRPLSPLGTCLRFACNAQGRVDLDALNPVELNRYLYARAMVGRVFHKATVHLRCASLGHDAQIHHAADEQP